MSEFIDLLEGTFANKTQAQSHPTRYAHIRVKHKKISEIEFMDQPVYSINTDILKKIKNLNNI